MKSLVYLLCLIFPSIFFAQQNSVLSTGPWYKVTVEETGVYRVTYDDLVNLGMDVAHINPQNLAIYGNPAGMLPELLEAPYYTDLQQMAIRVVGEEDNSFDPEDYILFYGQSPDVWYFDSETGRYRYEPDLYADESCYFLTVGNEPGKRIAAEPGTSQEPTGIPEYYDYLVAHNEDLVNPGRSGKTWLGEEFTGGDSLVFVLETGDITALSDEVTFHLSVAVNCSEPSRLMIKINRELYKTLELPVTQSDPYVFYRTKVFDSVCMAGQSDTRITLEFERPNDSAKLWLDCFELNMKQHKQFGPGNQVSFRTKENTGPGEITEFTLETENPEQIRVWNVTNPVEVKEVVLTASETAVTFRMETDSILEFHAFNGEGFLTPGYGGVVENQNLHALAPPELLIISYPDFKTQALQLADFHVEYDQMSTAVVTPQQIYNEFSTGSQDVTAIRNFVRYLYEVSGQEEPSYVLLFGDASYDYKDRIPGNTNFVPTYESANSTIAVNSFATDHYFGLQPMDNPNGNTTPLIGVGRIPARNIAEAETAVNKIVSYASGETLGNWKNEFLIIGDDGDDNLHMKFAEKLCDTINSLAPVANETKCYLGFYETVETGNPEAEELINEKMNTGVFYVNYTGHGGAHGLSQEMVVDSSTVAGWNNPDFLPIWVTASCEVAIYDDPDVNSLGEQIFLKGNGGSVAFIGNSRPAYASSNLMLNLELLAGMLGSPAERDVRLGDMMVRIGSQFHSEKYVLLGDPALKPAFPEFNVQTTTINGTAVEEFADTLLPGDRITCTGRITDKADGNLQAGFNGTVYLQVYAPPYIRQTIGNQGDPLMDVVMQDSLLAQGAADVVNGVFEISVTTPAVYYENVGSLKLSWYAENGETDAAGYYNGPVFGGEPSAVTEREVPADLIKVYPSPFTDYITIGIPENMSESISFAIHNLLGVKVYAGQIDSRLHEVRINLQHLSKGMYVLQLGNTEFRKSFKIIKK